MTDLEALCRTIAWVCQRNSATIERIKAEHPEISAEDIREADRRTVDNVWPQYADMATAVLGCLEARKTGADGVDETGDAAREPDMGVIGDLLEAYMPGRHYLVVALYPGGELKRITTLSDHHEARVLRVILEGLEDTAPHDGGSGGGRTIN